MGRPVKKTSSPEQPKLCINENPEQPESFRSKRVRKSEQLGSGKKMVDVQGRTKFKASSLQRNKGGGERKAGIKAGSNDRKLEEYLKLSGQSDRLERINEELVKENERLKRAVNAVNQLIEQMDGQKNFMENSPMQVDSPKGKIDAPVPRTRRKRLVTTKVLEPDIKQILVKLKGIRANNKQLRRDNAKLYSKLTDDLAPRLESLQIESKTHCNEELTANKDVSAALAGKGTDPHVTPTYRPKSSTSSSRFMSYICWFFCKFGTQLGTALVKRLATALVKRMEGFLAS